jgi:hypothetical protein
MADADSETLIRPSLAPPTNLSDQILQFAVSMNHHISVNLISFTLDSSRSAPKHWPSSVEWKIPIWASSRRCC